VKRTSGGAAVADGSELRIFGKMKDAGHLRAESLAVTDRREEEKAAKSSISAHSGAFHEAIHNI
jgi:hypothetical protein